jgi:hypothetical protein
MKLSLRLDDRCKPSRSPQREAPKGITGTVRHRSHPSHFLSLERITRVNCRRIVLSSPTAILIRIILPSRTDANNTRMPLEWRPTKNFNAACSIFASLTVEFR